MSKPFYERLTEHIEDIAKVMKGQASAARIFPNTSDIGNSRELIYAKFLKEHAPSKCNVFLGGFLFGIDGTESDQLDVIITSDTTPKFDFNNVDEKGKSFAPIDGCIGVASIKSTLDKKELFNALKGLASLPDKKPLLKNKVNPMLEYNAYDDWPYKIIYAHEGLKAETIMKHIIEFYGLYPTDFNKWPNIIHVAGKYAIIRARKGNKIHINDGSIIVSNGNHLVVENQNPDLIAISTVIEELQKMASTSTYIIFSYNEILENLRKANPIK